MGLSVPVNEKLSEILAQLRIMKDIMSGVQAYRNPKLVHILDKLNFIENYGTGISRTILGYNDSIRKPKFKATENFFTAILPNLNFKNDQIKANISDFELEC